MRFTIKTAMAGLAVLAVSSAVTLLAAPAAADTLHAGRGQGPVHHFHALWSNGQG